MDTSDLEQLQAQARAHLKTLTPHQREAHIKQKRQELAATIEQINRQLVGLALIDIPISLEVHRIGITRRRENAPAAKVTMSPVPGYIQVIDVTDIPSRTE